jgi:hypothetical protein
VLVLVDPLATVSTILLLAATSWGIQWQITISKSATYLDEACLAA